MGISRGVRTAFGATAAGVAIARLRRGRRRIDFAGRAVAITGGSRGLGLALARAFVGEGAKVALLAREGDALDRAAAELRASGTVVAVPCDLRDPASIAPAIEAATAAFGRLDVLVNNAGTIVVGPLEHMDEEDFAAALDIHLWGPLRTMRAAIPSMRAQGRGRIVNIASVGGLVAVPHLAPYSASKFALVGLSDAFRAELARDNILVTTVNPGLMRTGSPVNAAFKGRHEEEYRWFAAGDVFPLASIAADRAARQILDACRHGDPELTISWQAKVAALANALTPGLVADVTRLATWLLPSPDDETAGDRARTGWASQTDLFLPVLNELLDDTVAEFNQRLPNAANAPGGVPTMGEARTSSAPLTPSQAEGERDVARAAEERGEDSLLQHDPERMPSQAEGDREMIEEDLRRQGLEPRS